MPHSSSLTTTTMPPIPKKPTPIVNSPSCPSQCRHSPSATLDLLIFILVLFAGTFLIISYFSYIFQSLSLLLPSFSSLLSHFYQNPQSQLIFIILFFFFFVTFLVSFEICFGHRSRRCGKSECKGLKKVMEFDLQLQGEEMLREGSKAVRDVNKLPWKGGSEDNADYECLRAELRKMAPVNGRAVLLFRAKCGCPHSKLEGWGAKRGRRNKKNLVISGGGDHRR